MRHECSFPSVISKSQHNNTFCPKDSFGENGTSRMLKKDINDIVIVEHFALVYVE